jgi:hypothetical protein
VPNKNAHALKGEPEHEFVIANAATAAIPCTGRCHRATGCHF